MPNSCRQHTVWLRRFLTFVRSRLRSECMDRLSQVGAGSEQHIRSESDNARGGATLMTILCALASARVRRRRSGSTHSAASGPQRQRAVRFYPVRVQQHSLGSPRSGAPQVAGTEKPNPNGVPQCAWGDVARDVEPRQGSIAIGRVSWGAPLRRRPQALLCDPVGVNRRWGVIERKRVGRAGMPILRLGGRLCFCED